MWKNRRHNWGIHTHISSIRLTEHTKVYPNVSGLSHNETTIIDTR